MEIAPELPVKICSPLNSETCIYGHFLPPLAGR
jgi:hypothetical protein